MVSAAMPTFGSGADQFDDVFDVLAAQERELELELGQATTEAATTSAGPCKPPAKRRTSLFSPLPAKRMAYSASEWRERAFPGLAERRWLQLLVDEEIYVWADPVTSRQFLPELDASGCFSGSFLEIDCEHPCFIDGETLRSAIAEHKRTRVSSNSRSNKISSKSDRESPSKSVSVSDLSDVTGEIGGDSEALSPATTRVLANRKQAVGCARATRRRVVRSLEL